LHLLAEPQQPKPGPDGVLKSAPFRVTMGWARRLPAGPPRRPPLPHTYASPGRRRRPASFGRPACPAL